MKKGTCKHYTGDHHNTHCDAGICYRDVTTDPDNIDGSAFRKPCTDWAAWFTSQGRTMNAGQLAAWEQRGSCDKYEEPTAEEIAKFEAEMSEAIDRIVLTMPLCSRIKKEHRGKNWQGIEKCPACGGNLHIRHAGCNGHIHAHCETKDCISFME